MLLRHLVNRPVLASNISSPALFRVIEQGRPTLLIDEGDRLLRGNHKLKGILNAGYNRDTGFVVRVVYQSAAAENKSGQARFPTRKPVSPKRCHHFSFFFLVPKSHRHHWPLARNPRRPLHCHPHAAQNPPREMRAPSKARPACARPAPQVRPLRPRSPSTRSPAPPRSSRRH